MWCQVQPEVSQFTTTVSYDRAGIGMSDPGPEPRDARQIARELHTALCNARLAPPYLLVGHSFGGPLIRVFAGMYPDDIAGLVLVDPTQEEFINRDSSPAVNRGSIPDNDWNQIQSSLTEAHESRVPDKVPVVLITGIGPRTFPGYITAKQILEYRAMRQLWLKFHAEWLAKIPNAQHIVTDISGHNIPGTEPDLIIHAIRQMVEPSNNPPR
jgi:pimeloyl-ACP methyl ester carboxylesterase